MNPKGTILSSAEYSSFELSYIGDAFYELWCRQEVLKLVKKPKDVQLKVVHMVRCQTQARLAALLLPILTEEETKIYRRGKNSKIVCPKHASMKEYREATGFECIVGYWFLNNDLERFTHFMDSLDVRNIIDAV